MSSLFSLPESLAEGRWLLAVDVPPLRRKQLGQCFTGLQTGRLLAALAVRQGQKRITDPMAGHGDLIESAAERASRLHLAPDELVGVEIEPEAARLGKWRVERCAQEFGFKRGHFIHGDAFDETTWNESRLFDLVITNPPYVRYQTLSKRAKESGVKLLNADATRRALARLAVKLAPPEERLIWQQLIRSYSGLADLSLPSWLLCGLLTAPSGVLALVVPQTWLNRDYAQLARYFFLRFFEPLAVAQESGQRWFREALVPVSLVVGRRLTTDEAIIPLRKRQCAFRNTPFVEIESAAASGRSHVGNSFTGDDPEGEFAEWLETSAGSRVGVKLKRVSWESQRDEILAVTQGTEWLRRLEEDFTTGIASVSSATASLPPSIAPLLPPAFLSNARTLASESIRVGQGLRTGCNAFFYVELAEDAADDDFVSVLTSELFGRQRLTVPASVLKPILRRQSELSRMQIIPAALRGRLLDLRCFVLPENAQRKGVWQQKDCLVMPEELANYVRLAARTYLVRGEARTLIPCLSAVKTNGLGPSEASSSPLLFGEKVARMWYMVPDFAPRHTPSLCVPRIIHNEPIAILNAEPPVLVDANFSTLWCESDAWSAESVFATLNSTWGELCMEALGATLGGGALKLEATHLRQLPVPVFSNSAQERLRSLAREALDSARTMNEFRHHRSKIDQVVISALSQRQVSVNETKGVVEELAGLIRTLRAKRRRNHNYKALDEE
jgi:hypothetical protein